MTRLKFAQISDRVAFNWKILLISGCILAASLSFSLMTWLLVWQGFLLSGAVLGWGLSLMNRRQLWQELNPETGEELEAVCRVLHSLLELVQLCLLQVRSRLMEAQQCN